MNENIKKKVICVPKDGVISTRDGSESAKAKSTPKAPKEDSSNKENKEKGGSKETKEKVPSKETKDKVTSKENKEKGSGDNKEEWTQNQQKIFEWGLSNYPKGTPERWEKVAEHIPGKDKVSQRSYFSSESES